MATKPGSKEEAELADEWARKHVRSGESALVKRQRAYLPREGDDDYIEGSE